jgi:ABC-2 type transport system permease protein
MRNILLIAKREYLEQIRGRAFRVSTVVVPLLMLVVLGGTYFMGHGIARDRHLTIAADDPALANEIRRQLQNDDDTKSVVDVVAPVTQQQQTALLNKVKSKSIDGLLTIANSSSSTPVATYFSRSSRDFGNSSHVERALNSSLLKRRLTAAGMKQDEADSMLEHVSIKTLQVDKNGKTGESRGMAQFNKSMMMVLLLTIPIIVYGLDMARSIIDEKGSRIFEVMLAVARPEDMLAGKLIGVGAVGMTQISIWLGAAAVISIPALAASLLTGSFAIHFSWVEAVFFPIYFILGFFLYSSLFSGLAATCETAQDLQMYTPLAIVPVWISTGILPILLNDPNSGWAVVASLFPLTAPFVMIPRLGLAAVPPWQVASSIIFLAASVWIVLWASSRLYRVGILMYGKRATLPELLRWLRFS